MNDENLKERTIEELKQVNDLEVMYALLLALKDNSAYIRELALEALADYDCPIVISSIIQMIDDDDPLIRTCALEKIADLEVKSEEVKKVFLKALFDKNSLVRATVVESIGLLNLKEFSNDLERCLSDKDPLVRAYAAFALGQLKSAKSTSLLEEKLSKEKSSRVRLRFYASLYLLGKNNYIRKVFRLLKSRDFVVRSAAVSLLGHIMTSENKELIKFKLNELIRTETNEFVIENIYEVLK